MTTRRARIALYCDLIAKAAIDGIARQQGALGVDIGASAEAPVEPALGEAAAKTGSLICLNEGRVLRPSLPLSEFASYFRGSGHH